MPDNLIDLTVLTHLIFPTTLKALRVLTHAFIDGEAVVQKGGSVCFKSLQRGRAGDLNQTPVLGAGARAQH